MQYDVKECKECTCCQAQPIVPPKIKQTNTSCKTCTQHTIYILVFCFCLLNVNVLHFVNVYQIKREKQLLPKSNEFQ